MFNLPLFKEIIKYEKAGHTLRVEQCCQVGLENNSFGQLVIIWPTFFSPGNRNVIDTVHKFCLFKLKLSILMIFLMSMKMSNYVYGTCIYEKLGVGFVLGLIFLK